jgi:hypothetical protein
VKEEASDTESEFDEDMVLEDEDDDMLSEEKTDQVSQQASNLSELVLTLIMV